MSLVPDSIYTAGDQHLFVRRLGVDLGHSPDSMRGIVEQVARKHGLSVEDLKGVRRTRGVVHARQEAMWLMVQTRKFSLPQIGMFLGKRDHTTVLHGARSYEERRFGITIPQLDVRRARHRARALRISAAKKMAAE